MTASSKVVGIAHNLNETGKEYEGMELIIRYLKDQKVVARLKNIKEQDIYSENLINDEEA